jgi:hypothetical protein
MQQKSSASEILEENFFYQSSGYSEENVRKFIFVRNINFQHRKVPNMEFSKVVFLNFEGIYDLRQSVVHILEVDYFVLPRLGV